MNIFLKKYIKEIPHPPLKRKGFLKSLNTWVQADNPKHSKFPTFSFFFIEKRELSGV